MRKLPYAKQIRPLLLLIALVATAATAKSPARKPQTPPNAITKTLIQIEREWSQAGAHRDTTTMDRILADDWISVDFHGVTVSKAQAIEELKSSPAPTQSIELGEMKVRIFGTTAVVTGKDSSGSYAWMDVFMKRNGRWQAVASQSAKVEK